MARGMKRRRAMTNAERQALYRERHLKDVDGDSGRLNMVVPVSAKRQLERLARHYGVTQRDMLATLLAKAEGRVAGKLGSREQKRYYNGG